MGDTAMRSALLALVVMCGGLGLAACADHDGADRGPSYGYVGAGTYHDGRDYWYYDRDGRRHHRHDRDRNHHDRGHHDRDGKPHDGKWDRDGDRGGDRGGDRDGRRDGEHRRADNDGSRGDYQRGDGERGDGERDSGGREGGTSRQQENDRSGGSALGGYGGASPTQVAPGGGGRERSR